MNVVSADACLFADKVMRNHEYLCAMFVDMSMPDLQIINLVADTGKGVIEVWREPVVSVKYSIIEPMVNVISVCGM